MSSSILLRNNVFNSLLAFFFLKLCTFSSFQRFLCWETIPSTFLSKFSFEIYLSPIINYWGRVFKIYLKWEAFILVCVLSVFFFLSFFFFLLFLSVFSLTDTNDSQDSREGRGNHYFSLFPLLPAHQHSSSSSRFLLLPTSF